jgi:predicted protein tyrosine phosphatase
MISAAASVLTICGIEELPSHSTRQVTHVLSVLDPDWPDLDAFGAYGEHHRATLRFHDIIDPQAGRVMPAPEHMEAVLAFGRSLDQTQEGHLLVHCHAGVSRSTASMLAMLAQAEPGADEDALFARLRAIRPQAWPNSVMVGHADDLLGRGGRLVAALARHYGHQKRASPNWVTWMTELGRTRELDMAA